MMAGRVFFFLVLCTTTSPCWAQVQASFPDADAAPSSQPNNESGAQAEATGEQAGEEKVELEEQVALEEEPAPVQKRETLPEEAPSPPPVPVIEQTGGWSGADRQLIEDQIDELEDKRDEKYSLGGPIAATAVGGGLTVTGLFITLYGAVFSAAGSASSAYGGSSSLERTGHTLIVGGLSVATVGAGFVIGGLVWLNGRLAKRKPYNDQIDELENYLDRAAYEVRPLIGEGTYGLEWRVAF